MQHLLEWYPRETFQPRFGVQVYDLRASFFYGRQRILEMLYKVVERQLCLGAWVSVVPVGPAFFMAHVESDQIYWPGSQAYGKINCSVSGVIPMTNPFGL
jgi:hypothetical protein